LNEERLFILKMLEEGKINAQEAAALLEALEASGPAGDDEARGRREDGPRVEVGAFEEEDEDGERRERSEKSWSEFSRELAQQIRESVQQAMRGVPQIKEELRENLHEVREELSHSLKEVREELKKGPLVDVSGLKHLLVNVFGRGPSHAAEEEIKGVWAQETRPDLKFVTKNGSITVVGWDEPHYRVTIRKRAYAASESEAKKLLDEAIRVTADDRGLSVVCREGDRVSVSIEARVPKSWVYSLIASSTNGSVTVEGIETIRAEAVTTNGPVRARDVKGIQVMLRTTNGRIAGEQVQANDVEAITTNGSITWDGTAREARLATTNGSIRLVPRPPHEVAAVDRDGDEKLTVKYTAETTNAGIRVRLPAEAGLGVRVTAHGMGVDLGPDSHRFAIDHESHDGPTHTLIAATRGYDDARRRMVFQLKTTNGSIRFETERARGDGEPRGNETGGDES